MEVKIYGNKPIKFLKKINNIMEIKISEIPGMKEFIRSLSSLLILFMKIFRINVFGLVIRNLLLGIKIIIIGMIIQLVKIEEEGSNTENNEVIIFNNCFFGGKKNCLRHSYFVVRSIGWRRIR